MGYKLKAGYNKVITKVEKKEEVIKGGLILIEGSTGNMVDATVIAAPSNDEVGVSDKVVFDKTNQWATNFSYMLPEWWEALMIVSSNIIALNLSDRHIFKCINIVNSNIISKPDAIITIIFGDRVSK